MSLFGRYVLRQTVAALMLILGSLSGVVWIALALKQLKLVTNEGQDAWILFKMTTLALPNLMVLIAPIALLIATIHVLNRLNGDSELIVLTASGASLWHVCRPLLLLAGFVAVAVSIVNHFGMPASAQLLRQYVIQVRTDLISQVLQPGRFSSPESKLTIHMRDRAQNGDLYGLLMHDERDPKQVVSYMAERGRIIRKDDSAFLVMHTGHIVRRTAPDAPAQLITFDTYAFDLAEFQPPRDVVGVKPREYYTSELVAKQGDRKVPKSAAGELRAELHERFASALYPIVFVLLAVAFAGRAQSTRQTRTRALMAAFVFSVALRLGGIGVNSLVKSSASAVPLLYGVPLTGMLLGLGLIWFWGRMLR